MPSSRSDSFCIVRILGPISRTTRVPGPRFHVSPGMFGNVFRLLLHRPWTLRESRQGFYFFLAGAHGPILNIVFDSLYMLPVSKVHLLADLFRNSPEVFDGCNLTFEFPL